MGLVISQVAVTLRRSHGALIIFVAIEIISFLLKIVSFFVPSASYFFFNRFQRQQDALFLFEVLYPLLFRYVTFRNYFKGV